MNLRNHSFVSKLAVGLLVSIVSVLVFAKQDQTVLVGNDDKVTFETPVRI